MEGRNVTTYQNVTRTCQDCQIEYVWDARDQRFSDERGYLPPKRCPRCRQIEKQRRREQATSS
jgi:hypothetical protein